MAPPSMISYLAASGSGGQANALARSLIVRGLPRSVSAPLAEVDVNANVSSVQVHVFLGGLEARTVKDIFARFQLHILTLGPSR